MGAALSWVRKSRALMQLRMGAVLFRPAGHAQPGALGARYPIEGGGVEAACAAVRALLGSYDRTAIDVHLACGWGRLLLLPWMDQLTTELRWQTYAQARFEQVFGESTQAWEIHVAGDVPGRDRIAVAWPQALRQTLAAHRNVRSVRIGLLEHLGVLLAHEPDFSGCLIEIESDGAGFVLLLNGRARRVRWSRFDDDEGLSAAVRSEWASVIAAESESPVAGIGLGLTPPIPEPGSARAATVGALATGLGFNRAFSLPEWP
jgi:hypothetical protein